ncbi:MAG TPA: aldehyde dehydrogenase family protein [Terriglobia bacterium]|nr:aldehyde dehydrogenase family protein [Terriglobia bacterium]
MATATATGTALHLKNFINGESVDAISGARSEVRDPATGELVGTVPKCGAEDARKAIDAADAAFEAWSETSVQDRARLLTKAHEIVHHHIAELALLLSREQGKPVSEANTELEHFLHGIEFYAGLATKVRGAHVPLPDFPNKGAFGLVMKRPIGVCVGIVPWNFPITLMGTKVGPALAAGNTIVIKPASTTPLTAIRVIELMNEAGFPKGVLNIITGAGSTCGEELITNPKVRRVAFTGASNTGQHIMEMAGRDFKRVTLELGGSDPMIVCDDADLGRAASMAMVGRFFNCGQQCLGVKRLYVFESVADQFIEQLVAKAKKLKIGVGTDKDTRLGPLHTDAQRQEVQEQVEDAVKRGAKVLTGGKPATGFKTTNFYEPTLLIDVPHDSRVVQEEVFGPALPIFKVKDLDEAIRLANSSIYGLGSSIWTRDLAKANKAANKLQAGVTWINSLHYGYDELPFGGVKMSGIGREHGPEALEYYFEPKGVVYAGLV